MMIDGLFPTFVYGVDVPNHKELNQRLEKDIIQWSKESKGLQKTNRKGWHSDSNMQEKPEYQDLVKILYSLQDEIYQHQSLDRKPRMVNMWANINYEGGHNIVHVHPNCLFSGVYYVKTKPNCGSLILGDPRLGAQIQRGVHVDAPFHMQQELKAIPQEGRVLMFPSWMFHMVEPNESGEDRISISFNFIQEGFQR